MWNSDTNFSQNRVITSPLLHLQRISHIVQNSTLFLDWVLGFLDSCDLFFTWASLEFIPSLTHLFIWQIKYQDPGNSAFQPGVVACSFNPSTWEAEVSYVYYNWISRVVWLTRLEGHDVKILAFSYKSYFLVCLKSERFVFAFDDSLIGNWELIMCTQHFCILLM